MFQLHPQLAADTAVVVDLPLSRVLFMDESQFPWAILVPRRSDISEIYQLCKGDREQLQEESHQLSSIMMEMFKGDKLNIGALGNLVPQLHIHHIVRFKNDIAWPQPVWGNFDPKPFAAETLKSRRNDLRERLIVNIEGAQ